MAITTNPNVPQIANPIADLGALATVAQQLKQGLDSLAGNRGDPQNRAVTFNDLTSLGLLNRSQASAGSTYTGAVSSLPAETAARIAADSTLGATIAAETKRAEAAEAALTTVVDNEMSIIESLPNRGALGVTLNGGIIEINNLLNLNATAGGTLAIAPLSGTSDVIVHLPVSGGTVTLTGVPSFPRQRCNLEIKQGSTASVVNLDSKFVFGSSGGPTSYTATAIANQIDRMILISPEGTHWAVMGMNLGFTI